MVVPVVNPATDLLFGQEHPDLLVLTTHMHKFVSLPCIVYFGGKAQPNVIGVWAVAERPDELNSSSKIHATYDVTGNW